MKKYLLIIQLLCGSLTSTYAQVTYTYPNGPFGALFDGDLIGADYWDTLPRILSAGLGFSDIVAIDTGSLSQSVVEQAGGAWLSDISCGVNVQDFTSTSLRSQVQTAYIYQNGTWQLQDGAIGLDGLPVVFSWPVLTHTIDPGDFRLILNTGDTVKPYMTSTWPNIENNERNCVVLFGEFSNRRQSSDVAARFPVKCEVVSDGSPLSLIGPNGQVSSAVGLSWETSTNPYDANNGPRLVGAKLNRINGPGIGEGTSNNFLDNLLGLFPNDAFALYGGGDFRLRMLSSGGFSPDGVRGIRPNEFERYFRIHVLAADGSTMLLDKTDTLYQVQGGTLKVLGLSDLGLISSSYDDCYDEDRDNYIDIIIEGDEAAARNITHLEIPSIAGGYDPLYNPGGPGSSPFQGVVYTSPGPPDLEPVIIALDDPWRVTADSSFQLATDHEKLAESLFSVYPNPAREVLYVETEDNFNGHFEIYHSSGALVLESKVGEIDITSLEPGLYIIIKRNLNMGKHPAIRFVKMKGY